MAKFEYQSLKKYLHFIYPLIIIIIIAFGIYLRTRLYLYKVEFWLDEVMTALSYIDKGIGALFMPLEAEQKAPPLYLLTVYFIVKIFGFNELAFRFIPYISGCLSVIAFYFLLNAFVKDKIGKIFGLFLFAISIPLIYNSAEFKPYSSDTLICILLFLFYNYCYIKNTCIINGKVKQAILYTLITMLLIFFSFPAAFIIFSLALTNCIFERKITKTSMFVITGIIISCSVIYLMDVNVYPFMKNFWWWNGHKTLEFMYLTSIKYFMTVHSNIFCDAFVVLVIVGLTILFKEKKQIATAFFICILVPVITSLLKIYPFEERLILYLLPILLLLITKLFDYNVFHTESGKLKIIQKLILCTLLILMINIKVPYINFSQEKLIDYSRKDDFKRSIHYREEMKNVSLYVLNNYSGNQKILTTNEFYYFIRYYNKYYNLKKDIPITFLGWNNNGKIIDIMNEFFDKNSGKYTMWFISRSNENYFRTWKWYELISMIRNRNLSYNFIIGENGAYLIVVK